MTTKKTYEQGKKEGRLEREKEILKIIDELIFAMQQSRDCFGYNPHKVFTTNLCYGYDIEKEDKELTKENRKLLYFAMGCYQNGWLEAVNRLEELKQKIQEGK